MTVPYLNEQVLRNKAVSKDVRKLRAQALHELGGIFLDAAASYVEAAPIQDQVTLYLQQYSLTIAFLCERHAGAFAYEPL